MSDDTVTIEVKGLKQLLKALGQKAPSARVGVLGSKSSRSGPGTNNAEVGAAHEFGTQKLPIRSFLREPISDNLQKYLENSKAFDEETLKEVLRAGSIQKWMEKVGITAERVVADAFDTGGFGKWQPSDMTHKKNQQTLVETKQLRESITSEVK